MADPITGLAVLAGGVKAGADIITGEETAVAFRRKAAEARLKGTTETILRQQKLRKIIGSDIAQGAARGITADSGSLKAIEIDNFNQFAQDEELASLQTSLEEQFDKSQARQAEASGFFGAFGDLFGIGQLLAGGEDIPSKRTDFDIFGKKAVPAGSGIFLTTGNFLTQGSTSFSLPKFEDT